MSNVWQAARHCTVHTSLQQCMNALVLLAAVYLLLLYQQEASCCRLLLAAVSRSVWCKVIMSAGCFAFMPSMRC